MKLYIVIGKIFIISALLIVSNYNLALKDASARERFYDMYYVWLSDVFDKASFVTGYVIKSEWLPKSEVINSSSQVFLSEPRPNDLLRAR